ncbi:MAG: DUF2796 domain-containing protein [Bdellovibrionota bacterium]
MKSCFSITILFAIVGISVLSRAESAAKHVHGNATLQISLEKNDKVVLALALPGESAVGFEHEPQGPAEIQKFQATENLLKEKFANLVQAPAAADCIWGNPRVLVDYSQKGHSMWKVDIFAVCAKPLAKQTIRFAFAEHFPALTNLSVTVRAEKSASTTEIKKGSGDLVL